ncbi:hypothetical protein DXG03_006936 [Asterophora parasitica]|uniref:Uncharacterized protein n=1 Tax=Asterophora parasitica TaxID=117018 RepID=A0A9P7K154_9AGAR|nr:hypothetical protein DXG03_006936 [Asterophora parasitica]
MLNNPFSPFYIPHPPCSYGSPQSYQCPSSYPTSHYSSAQSSPYYQRLSPLPIEHLKQGAIKIDDFMVKFEALVTKSGITDLQAIDLLEQNINTEIIQALFYQGK